MSEQLDSAGVRQMLLLVAARVIAAKEQLTDADRAIGDGDHGIGMARGFEAVQQALADAESSTIGELFKITGRTIMSNTGGAAGAVFGILFNSAAKAATDADTLDAALLTRMLRAGLDGVQARGRAQPGDKTMVDVLLPAVEAAEADSSGGLAALLDRVSTAATAGLEQTRHMVATLGKAKTLGERSLGHPDPGAVSTCIILQACRDFVHTE